MHASTIGISHHKWKKSQFENIAADFKWEIYLSDQKLYGKQAIVGGILQSINLW